MYNITLILHISIGIVSLLTTVAAFLYATKLTAKKYLYFLLLSTASAVISGVLMAGLSESVTAISLCQNLALYTVVVGAGVFAMYTRAEKIQPKGFAYAAMPVVMSYILFIVAIVKEI